MFNSLTENALGQSVESAYNGLNPVDVTSCAYVCGLLFDEPELTVVLGEQCFDLKSSPEEGCAAQLAEGVLLVSGQEADLRLLVGSEPSRADARIEIRLGAKAEIEFADAAMAMRGGEVLECIGRVISQWKQDPELPAGKLSLCASGAIEGGFAERPDCGLHECFSKIAANDPELIAVSEMGVELSYLELDGKSDQLAKLLVEQGVRPGDAVATFMTRGIDFCVSVLGILKAGAAYLPIDPEYPADRRQIMLDDGACQIVLRDTGTEELGLAITEIVVEHLNLEAVVDESIRVSRSGDDAAYIIFTSGSTGRPKGVNNTHRGALNEVLSCVELWGLCAEDRIPQFASISFDVAVEEIWATWLAGARLVVTPPNVIRSHAHFMGWVESEGVTVLSFPTAFWHSVVSAVEKGDAKLPQRVGLVVVGGEFARRSAYSSWKKLVGQRVRWVNAYGPTEAAIACTFYRDWVDGDFSDDVPIGKPVPNSVAYVVDREGRALPRGFSGELWIGGDGIALGYIGLPERTAQSFIDDPFANEDGARVYKTGDHVWADEQGRLHYIGRRDRQEKIRGFRIELDEVEDALNSLPDVADAAIKALEVAGGGKELVAYVAPALNVESLIKNLLESLPSQMIPTRFVGMDQLPVTTNGKIDYKNLPDPCVGDSGGEAGEIPDDPIIEAVLEELRNAVKFPGLGPSDNFFSMGGHSLRMMELIAALARRGLEISAEEFVQAPTAEGLAAAVKRRRERPVDETTWSPLKPLREIEGAPVLILPHSTPGDVMGYGSLVNHLGADVSCYGLVARGAHSNLEPHRDLKEMASYYVDAIVGKIEGPYNLCGWCFGGMLSLEIAQQLKARGEEVGRLILIDTEVPPMEGLGWFRRMGKLRLLRAFPIVELLKYFFAKVPGPISGGTDDDPHARDTEVYRMNEEAYDNYTGERYSGHIDEIISGINLWDGLTVLFSDDTEGLAADSAERFDVHGDHMTLMRDPVVADVAARIRELLLRGS